jgi:hypothetical protein
VNHAQYRAIRNEEDRREYNREAKRRERARRATASNDVNPPVNDCQACQPIQKQSTEGKKNKNMSGKPDEPEGFAAFWAAYPKKDARKDALRAYRALAPSAGLQATMLAAIAIHQSGRQWRDGFIPLAATWVRGERWSDAGLSPVAVASVRPKGDPKPPGYTRTCPECRTYFEPPRFDDGSVKPVYTCPACERTAGQQERA